MGTYHLYPITPYNTYLGKPLYRFSKKHLGDSQFLALNMADVPASIALAGASYAATPNVGGALFIFTIHQLIMSLSLSTAHRSNVDKRMQKRAELETLLKEMSSDGPLGATGTINR